MSTLQMFAETGAIGDTAIALCRAFAAMVAMKHVDAVIHTAKTFKFGKDPEIRECPFNPNVITILENCSFVKEIVFDCDYKKPNSLQYSEKYNCKIEQPTYGCDFVDIRRFVSLYSFVPDDYGLEGKIAVFQPISLRSKPKKQIDSYIAIWNESIKALIDVGYKIVMIGGKDDPYQVTFNAKYEDYIINKCGKWTILQSLAYLLYRADIVLSCDSWAAWWGIASRLPTLVAWGHRMQNKTDLWLLDFLGNKDCYKYGWASNKENCDKFLAEYIGKMKD